MKLKHQWMWTWRSQFSCYSSVIKVPILVYQKQNLKHPKKIKSQQRNPHQTAAAFLMKNDLIIPIIK